MSKYIPIIGLEIHAELKTKSKMFCSCKNNPFSSKQNENICPVCLGMPGTLPVLNKQAIDWTIMTGLALNCKIANFTKWDRKNYFYPDLPKGYQISQYDLPIAGKGWLKLKTNNEKLKTIGITRIHLEEDTGTSKHPEGRAEIDYSLLDYNRSGTPLMELVTEPDINNAEEAKAFCKEYQLILRNLKVADADMEKGQMRCEANISIRKEGDKKLGTKVEIKNLNSFKAVERSIKYEIERQIEILEKGEKIIQETRGWDDAKSRTYTMRVKETSADYRYFPEPDLPPVRTTEASIKKLEASMPEMPDEKIKKYMKKYNLSTPVAFQLSASPNRSEYFESIANKDNAKKIANWMINEDPNQEIPKDSFIELLELTNKKLISERIAKEIIPEVKKGKKPSEVIKEKGLKQISDSGELDSIVEKIIKENPNVVAKIKAGKTQVMGFLVGQVMKATKGQANPNLVNEILRKKIK